MLSGNGRKKLDFLQHHQYLKNNRPEKAINAFLTDDLQNIINKDKQVMSIHTLYT